MGLEVPRTDKNITLYCFFFFFMFCFLLQNSTRALRKDPLGPWLSSTRPLVFLHSSLRLLISIEGHGERDRAMDVFVFNRHGCFFKFYSIVWSFFLLKIGKQTWLLFGFYGFFAQNMSYTSFLVWLVWFWNEKGFRHHRPFLKSSNKSCFFFSEGKRRVWERFLWFCFRLWKTKWS